MSKPYPHRGEPATWQEIVEQTGRTPQEIDDLHRHVESLGWKVQEVCKSMKCMYATIEVPEDGTVESIEDIAHDQLHRKLGERKSGGIVKAVRLLEKPATGNTTAEANHKASDLLRARSPFESHNMSRRLQSSSFPPQIVNSVYDITGLLREQVGLNRTLYDANFLQFLVVPVICNITSTTSNASALELESQGRDCDQVSDLVACNPFHSQRISSDEPAYGSFIVIVICRIFLSPFTNGPSNPCSAQISFPWG